MNSPIAFHSQIRLLFAILLGLASFSSCDFNCISVEGTGPMADKTFNVGTFNSIDSDISATINIRQSDVTSVSVSGQQNILDLLDIKVEGNKLLIDYTQQCVLSSFDSLIITISTPDITSIHLNGSGEIKTLNTINGQNIDLSIDGSGTIHASINVETKIRASISGSGDLFLDGTSANAELEISGSGEIHASELIAKNITIEISGSGDALVYATEKLDAKVSGSGDIQYKGSPQVNTSISGSGDVSKID